MSWTESSFQWSGAFSQGSEALAVTQTALTACRPTFEATLRVCLYFEGTPTSNRPFSNSEARTPTSKDKDYRHLLGFSIIFLISWKGLYVGLGLYSFHLFRPLK